MKKRKQLLIRNRLGLHARAAAKLVKLTTGFESQVSLSYSEREVNAKSILGLLMLAAPCGTEVEVIVEGPDAEQALEQVEDLFMRRFDEE